MTFAAAWSILKGLAQAANAALSLVPPLVWAFLLAGALMHGCTASLQRDRARSELKTLTAAVERQNNEAAAKLKAKTEEAKAIAKQLAGFTAAQEKIDEKHQAAVADLSRRLRAAGQLRDPGWQGSRCPASQGSTGAGDRAGDASDASGLLSPQLTGVLLDRAEEADRINNAYTSCRADALNLRSVMARLGSCQP